MAGISDRIAANRRLRLSEAGALESFVYTKFYRLLVLKAVNEGGRFMERPVVFMAACRLASAVPGSLRQRARALSS